MSTPTMFLFATHTSSAVMSSCGTYRYELCRSWSSRPAVGFVMLNPSTADAQDDDPTIRRCVGFARSWGYGGIVVRNLYALRATDPRALRTHPDPIGPDNGAHLSRCRDVLTICAWGAHGARSDRAARVVAALRALGVDLHHLGLTKAGQPRHPLYLPATQRPVRWKRCQERTSA